MVRLRSKHFQFAVALITPIGLLIAAAPAWASCDGILPVPAEKASPSRLITSDDLLRLRDIGGTDLYTFNERSQLAISPDDRRVAFVINQADPASNSYCRALVVVDLNGAPNPRVVNRGGEFIKSWWIGDDQKTFFGVPIMITPIWSPDGRSIFFLRRDDGVTQLWRADADGGVAIALTHSSADVEDFSLSKDGKGVVYSSRPNEEAERQVDREALSGWHYDARISPSDSTRPSVAASARRQVYHLDLATGDVSTANANEIAQLPDADSNAIPAPLSLTSKSGQSAWIAKQNASRTSPQHLFSRVAGKTVECLAAGCDGSFAGFWWDAAGRDVFYLRRQGWDKDHMGLYRWRPGAQRPKQIFDTPDVLIGCVPEGRNLLCTQESSLQPRRIVRIDVATGHIEPVFDPNPEFKSIRFGAVERLEWKSKFGVPSWGELILPPDYNPGQKLPMIVVQYRPRGFQRGGTGDEYPIQLFAARGYAVLNVNDPASINATRNDLTELEATRADYKDWAYRTTTVASIQAALDIVIARGIVDPARIGITGLSSGSENARYALVNTHLFAAASISGDGNEPRATMIYYGSGIADRFAS